MRFNPPAITPSSELTWLLGAAFGPRLPAMTGDPDLVPDLAQQFDLAPRIVARHGVNSLAERLGGAAARLVPAHRRAVAVTMAAERVALEIAGLAARNALPIIFLKGSALQITTPGPDGWRPFVDLDVLLSRRAGEALRDALVAAGWAPGEEAHNPQHLAPLLAPNGIPLDIHYRLRGVRVAAARWATAEELLDAGLCRPAGLADGAWVPEPALMAAHLAVHAIEQHGHRPATYPLLRVVADIVDLAAADGAALAEPAERLVADSITGEELRSLFTLGRLLADGRTPTAGDAGEAGAERLLRHIVAGTLDPDYRSGLAIDHTSGRLRQARRDGELMRYIAHKLKGPESVRQTLLHQIRLGARFAAAAAARLRQTFHR